MPRPGPEVHLDEWVAPDIADDRGYLRAGKILEWMDVVGVLAAARHCRRSVVTASVDGLELTAPIRVGERVTMTASVAHTSERSVGISISVRHGAGVPSSGHPCVGAYMTFVAPDDNGSAIRVPQFLPETPAELARFREGELRREFRKRLASGALSSNASPSVSPDVPPAAHDADAVLLVREWLKTLPRLRMPWDRADPLRPRTRHVSYIHKIEPIRIGKLNFHGTLYGGTLMRWLEGAACLSARAYLSGSAVRLTSLQGLTFIRPAPRDLFVHIRSVVVHAASDQITVLVNVRAEDPVEGAYVDILRAFLSYAPLNPDETRVPPLEVNGEDDRALFHEVEHRRALQKTLSIEREASSTQS
jgi:acyl-CoA hydrolase